MKKEILKIAGVKSEKEFYKKFPDEASFMKAHGKEFKKAMRANKVDKAQIGDMIGGGGPSLDAGATNVGPSGGFSFEPSSEFGGGSNIDQSWNKTLPETPTDFSPYIQAGTDIVRGVSMIKQQRQKVRKAKQMANLTGLQSAAVASAPINPIKRQYIRPEDTVIQPDQLFPSQGVGTNVLAEDGAVINQIGGNPTEIMNTFAPNTIYSDMGYEPLSDSDKVKQFAGGGQLAGLLNDSKFGDIMGDGGGGDVLTKVGSAITKEDDAGTAIGGGIGQAAGTFFGGPVGGMLGKFAGRIIGDVLDRSERKIKKARKQTERNIASMMGTQAGMGIQNMFSANMKSGGILKAQGGKDLTKKDGKCAAEEARNKEYAAMDKEASRDLKALDKANAAAERIAARQSAKEMEDYLSEGLTGYGEKIKKKDFESAYQAFAAQNPELAKDRLLYTLANKEFNKVKRNPEYYMRNVLGKVDPSLDYGNITLPQLMQTMQKGFGGGQGYYDAWKEGFPSRTFAMPQLTPIRQQENGGQTSDYEWISHTWQPQVITHFGEHKVSDLLRPPADADMLRAGGEIKNLRKNYMSPEEEMLTNMAFGGQLKTTWGGHAEPISQNPYLPGTGQTVMFRGQSHDESDGKGRTGIGVKYGNHDSYTDYAEYGTEADADVEVERNEPAVELPDTKSQLDPSSQFAMGGGVDNKNLSMNVFGNLVISELVSPEYAGKRYKSAVKDLSEKTERSNKKIEKASNSLANLNPQGAYDMVKLNSLKATIYGENMKLKKIADDIQNLAAGQTAYNDTAEELGLDADKLAKGKVAMAKRGANIPKAQTGSVAGRRGRSELANVNPAIKGLLDLFAKKNYDVNATSGYRAGATTEQGRPSRHSKGEAMDVVFPTLGAGAYDALLNDPEVVEYMLQNDITAINEYDPETQKATGATGPHIHFGFDRGTSLSDKFRREAAAKYPSALTPITKTGLPKVSPENFKYLQDLYSAAQKEKRGPAVLKFQQEFHRLAPEYAKDVLSKYPVTAFGQKKGYKVTDLNQNLDSIFGKRTEQYMAALNSGMGDTPSGDMASVKELGELILSPSKKTEKKETTKVDITPKKSDALLKALSSMVPYLRPSDVEELDPNQLLGEMYALSTNQVEPVWAQKLTPRLSTPIDISLQDILDENRATLRRQQQMLGYNPAAQSAFAAQEYDVNKRVLGEQFRLNQAEKQRVYDKNRDILGQYDLANMGILDKQYERQATALSKTKATTQEALNSIASKYAQNRLENRTLATYENLYNYRYDPNFRAQSMQLAQWNIPDGTTASKVKETPVYGPDGKTILYYKTSDSQIPSLATPPINAKKGGSIKKRKDALNSSVVKALKNI